jgi:hypothetical protein
MTFPEEFRDLVNTDGLKKRAQVSATPFDDIQFWLKPASAASADVCEKLQRDAFGEQLAPTGQLRKIVPSVAEPVFTAPRATAELSKLASKLGKAWDSKKHRQKIQSLVDKLKNSPALASVKDDPQWDTLVTHTLDYVCGAIHAEAA